MPWLKHMHSEVLILFQGVLGHLLLKLNVAIAVYRRNSALHGSPILEVTAMTAITAAVSYLVVFLR
jgi:chloride channel 3/4/5